MTDCFEDYSDLIELDAEPVTVGKHVFQISPLTAADIKYTRKAIQLKQITAEESESFMAWLALKKLQPDIKWKDFSGRWLPKFQNLILAKVIVMNGFLELREAIDGKPGEPDESAADERLDFE